MPRRRSPLEAREITYHYGDIHHKEQDYCSYYINPKFDQAYNHATTIAATKASSAEL